MVPISPGQALLILIDHYQSDEAKLERLEKLYLSGVRNDGDKAEMAEFFKDPCLLEYQINYDSATINDDPTRRYFETHLAYQTLAHGLEDIDVNALREQFKLLQEMLPTEEQVTAYTESRKSIKPKFAQELEEQKQEFVQILAGIGDVLEGKYDAEGRYQSKVFSDYIEKIKSNNIFKKLPEAHKEKIILLAQCAYLGVMNAQLALRPLPLDIYGEGFFSAEQRGKVELQNQDTTRSSHLGLLKGHMPLPATDLARGDRVAPHTKASDLSSYDLQAEWPQVSFDTLVNPFSNSISGTVLCQLRSMRKLAAEGDGVFTDSGENMEKYMQLLTSSLLYNHGGHSLFEFTYPLTLEKVQDEFYATPGFSDISMESMFLSHNKPAFNEALQQTIAYNKMMLVRAKLHAQVKEQASLRTGAEPKDSGIKSQLLAIKDKDSSAQVQSSSVISPAPKGASE